ncbi:MAG: hypothetical protein PHX44_05820 [Sulfurimonas sp.]|uniref:hypothetical protein n=1 Tax=Sulfurimonas sp. TaxID=2022749 RepID=UPI002623A472|nr:hypothetical protein [Sulfurimonas sp.]MDD2652549.1 hypothetical protein [Sulfurimonas sp.]MDD3451276.1 hypothetical protein [Sulfurimonas sp.]
MKIDGDVLTIDLNLSMDEIVTLEEFIRPRIEYIERIETEDGSVLSSSALLSLLVSIKKTRPQIEIPFLEKEQTISFSYGTVHWTYHD